MIGYKAFDENLQCRGFQFETGRAKKDLMLTNYYLDLTTDNNIYYTNTLC